MKASVLSNLTAPGGGSPLRLVTVGSQVGDEIIEASALSVEQGMFAMHDGILDLLPRGVGRLSITQVTNLIYPVARYYETPWRVNALTLLSGQSLPPAREKEIIFDLLGSPPGALWLDLAASSGLYSRWLAPELQARDGTVVCLDLSRLMLRQAQAAAARENLMNVAFVAARAERLPFADGSLDGVLCGGSLNEFGPDAAHTVLRDLQRALKPGAVGVFMHLLRSQHAPGRYIQSGALKTGGLGFWDREETNALFHQHGFIVEKYRDVGMVGFTRIVKPEYRSTTMSFASVWK